MAIHYLTNLITFLSPSSYLLDYRLTMCCTMHVCWVFSTCRVQLHHGCWFAMLWHDPSCHCCMQVGYQFIMRFTNPHIYYLKKKSPLGKCMLHEVGRLPFEDSEGFRENVIDGICKSAGYLAVTDPEKHRDLYAFCIPKLIMKAKENSGHYYDNILLDQPLVSSFNTASDVTTHPAARSVHNASHACAVHQNKHYMILTTTALQAVKLLLHGCHSCASSHAFS